MWTATFWKATAERALKTFFQGLGSAMTAGGLGLLSVGWKQALAVAGFSTALSLATSIGSAKLAGDPESPSLVAGEK